ncbi:MAG TPA: hypothetical protein VMU16_03510 [Candidatus Binataceae bacterium]|nr:hypothetical protein [Candidatus Binataceae bacterium]
MAPKPSIAKSSKRRGKRSTASRPSSAESRLPAWLAPLNPLFVKLGAGDAVAGGGVAALFIATVIAYARSFSNEFVYDQRETIVSHQEYLARWSFFWKSLIHDEWWFYDPNHLPQSMYYRPLPNIWVAINFHLFGVNVAGWHAAMVALHLLVVWLVFRVGSILASDRRVGLLAAALFALTPLAADSVVFAFSYSLSAALMLGAFECYLSASKGSVVEASAQPGAGAAESDGSGVARWRLHWAALPSRRAGLESMGLFFGALLCQESAVVMPILIGLHVLIFPRRILQKNALEHGNFAKDFADLSDGDAPTVSIPIAVRARAAMALMWPYVAETLGYIGLRRWVL